MKKQALRKMSAGVAALALLSLTACGGGTKDTTGEIAGTGYDGPKVDISFWNGFTGSDGAYFDEMVAEFNEANPNIKVTTTTQEWTDVYGKLPIAVQSGNGPDVAVIHIDQVSGQAAQGALSPLDGVAESMELSESDFAPVVWNAGIYNGKRYSIPLDVHMHALYYNKDVLKAAGLDPETPPATGEELLANLETLKDKGVQGMWIDSSGWMRTWFTALDAQFGGTLFSDDGTKITWNDEAGTKALTFMRDLIDKGYSPANVGQDGYWKAFAANENAYAIGGVWELANPNFEGVDWGVAPLPVIGDKSATWGSSHQFVMTSQAAKDDDKAKAAAYFINEMSKDSIKWAKANQVPARMSVQTSEEFLAIDNMEMFAGLIDETALPPSYPGLADANGELEKAISAVLLGTSKPAEALESSAQQAQKIVDDNRARYGY